MVNFVKLENKFLLNDDDYYKSVGVIAEEDIQKLNFYQAKQF